MTLVNRENAEHAQLPHLEGLAWFAGLDALALGQLTREARPLSFKAEEKIFLHGQPCRDCLLVCSGELQGLRYTPEGDEKIFGHIRPGAFAALPSIFAQPQLHWHTIRASTPGRGWLFSDRCLRRFCQTQPEFALRVISNSAWLLHHHTEQIDWLTSSTAEQRLAEYVLRFGRPRNANPVRLPLSWMHVATKLGIRAETVSRILSKWQRKGLILRDRSGLHILNIASLEGMVDAHRRI
ncbi:Crp/Fnr family transcriptional regulator [Corticibacter populi]|uniref:Crp/Fnr family transcriptional regulator n=1 Tax=Corticibacter populi TaxID=1550736 RepID=A0A3M6QU26_9BURK|nr:Crp/Fnr family transcriptional regulator [Corticibacter populi]RMX06528.1 Crp/Fnr family transcriptional regulator [Corticibacter populi]RZS31909.1 CRP/FNR family transcriptional regulator [Corticibacter populi]